MRAPAVQSVCLYEELEAFEAMRDTGSGNHGAFIA